MSDQRIIVSLDFADQKKALAFCQNLTPSSCRIKIGKELFTRAGPAVVESVMAYGFDVFLDLKYHDIPNTVMRACHAAADLGVWMLNVHATGGSAMMEAAMEGIHISSHQPKLVAVTVLTSLPAAALLAMGIHRSVTEQVLMLARLAQSSGLDGVVCAAQEARLLSTELGKEFCLVTPGIRLKGAINHDDQKRIMEPTEAILAGSHYLVIGRPITTAADPVAVLETINTEFANMSPNP